MGRGGTTSPDKTLERERSSQYPIQVWYFVACFIATVSLFQFASWVVSKLFKRPKGGADAESGVEASSNRVSLRRIPMAIINTYRVLAFRCTLQLGNSYTLNLAEVFVTCAYIIALFVWEYVNTTDSEGVKFDTGYWGNRAGTIASGQIILVTALGTKNNVLSYITGISYEKLNYVHRMTARVVFVLLWCHSGVKLTASEHDREVWVTGLLAMIAFSLLILVSLRPIRDNAYEFFFLTHFSMVLIFIVGGYYHAPKMAYYFWPSLLVWGVDRFMRLVRVVVYNHLYFSLTSKKAQLDATVELLSPHFVRLRLSRPPHFHWIPGQTAYITMPSVSALPTEAHPFTIASIESTDKIVVGEKDANEVAPYWNELVFLINVRTGFTKRLAAAARKSEKVKVLVDGPYGFMPDLDNDDTVIFVAGGSGVALTLSIFLGIVNAVRAGKSACRKIIWIWAIRESSHIHWVSKALTQALELAPPQLSINIMIYVTAGDPLPVTNQAAQEDDSIHEASSSDGEKNSVMTSLLDYSAVQVLSGRPDLRMLLRDEVAAATGQTLSVTVCGSQGIARACRAALRFPVSSPSNVLKGGPNVKLHIEAYGYA